LNEVVAGLSGHVHASSRPSHTCAPLVVLGGGSQSDLWLFRVLRFFHTHKKVLNVQPRLTHLNTTFNNGSLGSRIDEERSEMR
jgi:hypothetical protein